MYAWSDLSIHPSEYCSRQTDCCISLAPKTTWPWGDIGLSAISLKAALTYVSMACIMPRTLFIFMPDGFFPGVGWVLGSTSWSFSTRPLNSPLIYVAMVVSHQFLSTHQAASFLESGWVRSVATPVDALLWDALCRVRSRWVLAGTVPHFAWVHDWEHLTVPTTG